MISCELLWFLSIAHNNNGSATDWWRHCHPAQVRPDLHMGVCSCRSRCCRTGGATDYCRNFGRLQPAYVPLSWCWSICHGRKAHVYIPLRCVVLCSCLSSGASSWRWSIRHVKKTYVYILALSCVVQLLSSGEALVGLGSNCYKGCTPCAGFYCDVIVIRRL